MPRGLSGPHILLASSNVRKLEQNLAHLLDEKGRKAIAAEIQKNTEGLFRLGEEHLREAKALNAASDWRHVVSRCYYSTHAISRSIRLFVNGHYSTETKDHGLVGDLPNGFPNESTYKTQLTALREDRNISDYDHLSTISDLVTPPNEAKKIAEQFRDDARAFFERMGVKL